MLDYLTFVSLRSHFAETNLIFLSLSQFADKVCKLKEGDFPLLFCCGKKKTCRIGSAGFFVTVIISFRER